MRQVTWREYHEATKHTAEKLRRSRHWLDWANMPDPFRHYEGAPLLDLPADPPPPGTPAPDGAAFLSQLLFYSAAISASKVVPATGARYALRVNPSSGNLHPTEFHFITRGLRQWPDGLYHYRPSSHMAEQRALGSFGSPIKAPLEAPIVFALTSIAWREAWKYQSRAYRYCLLDIGHAWQALELAARAMGCDCVASGDFADDDLAALCGLASDEWPMLTIAIRGASVPSDPPRDSDSVWFGGDPNSLSREIVSYPLIEGIHDATKIGVLARKPAPLSLPSRMPAIESFGDIARNRRSALDFIGGDRKLTRAQLNALLAAADLSSAHYLRLFLYVHRVEDLEAGVYSEKLDLIQPGDQRVAAAGLSLGQDLAGNACIAFSMIADLDRAAAEHGARGYRYAHFEAGAIGQRLYLAAEAQGLRATGIGAFYDDEVHRYLDLTPEQGQVIYHFAIGYPVPDPRLEA